MRIGRSRAAFGLLAWLAGLFPLTAFAQTIEVLWYSYAHPRSVYVETMQKIADAAHGLPGSSSLRWKVTFFGPDSPVPAFARYNVLVVQSGAGSYSAQRSADPKKHKATPDFSGILRSKAAIEAARGERTFISGADADEHAINGDTGNAPPDPSGRKARVVCNPPITGSSCWDGALGHLVNAVNWAGSGRGLGIVSLSEVVRDQWWLDRRSFLRNELAGFVTVWDRDRKRENNPVIPAAARGYALNSGLTSKGLGNWTNSFHAGFSHSIPGYVAIVDSTLYPNTAVAIATARFAGAAPGGPPPAPLPVRP